METDAAVHVTALPVAVSLVRLLNYSKDPARGVHDKKRALRSESSLATILVRRSDMRWSLCGGFLLRHTIDHNAARRVG